MIRLKDLSKLYVLKNVVLFESKLYEKLGPPYPAKYRVIITDDDYDYVTDEALVGRLDKAIKAVEKT